MKYLALGILGALIAIGLMIHGADVCGLASSGPRWRRRLLSAGIALLAAAGLGPAPRSALAQPSAAPPVAASPDRGDLAESPEWKRLNAVWVEASKIAASAAGSYPFDRAGQKRILEELAESEKGVGALQAAGRITETEAVLLKKHLADFVSKMNEFRPKEMEKNGPTCYEPMPPDWGARQSLDRLSERLPLLERLAREGKLHPAAIERVVSAIEKDLATLTAPKATAFMSNPDKSKAESTARAIRVVLDRIKGILGSGR